MEYKNQIPTGRTEFEIDRKYLPEPDQRLKDFFKMLKTYTVDGKMITNTELNKIGKEYKLNG